MITLSSKEKASLRAAAQRLKPAIHVGRQGLGEGALTELRKAFAREELVKVAFRAEREALSDMTAKIERALDCVCVGGVGRRRSFFRPLDPMEDGSKDF